MRTVVPHYTSTVHWNTYKSRNFMENMCLNTRKGSIRFDEVTDSRNAL